MQISSSDFEDKQIMPVKYSKRGQNVSPSLSWKNMPPETKSFALVVVDRHPVARNFIHWMVIDISSQVTSLEEGASGNARLPGGSRELRPYFGPNPPSGSHDYEFILYALNTEKLDLPGKVSWETFSQVVEKYTIIFAKIVGKFTRIKSG